MLVTFCVISALASSISSRTSTLIRSETSVTAVAMFSGFPFSAGKALEDQGGQETAGERGADRELGTLAGPEDVCAEGPSAAAAAAQDAACVSTVGPGRRCPGRRSLGRLFVEHALPDHGATRVRRAAWPARRCRPAAPTRAVA